MKKSEFLRAIKFFLFSISAGIIQFSTTTILSLIWPVENFSMGPVTFYLIGLVLSVIWNVTFNRKFTFKSASNLSIAIIQTIGFYIVFAPASCFLQAWLTNGDIFSLFVINHLNLHSLVGTLICMVLNLVLEWPYQRYIVFRKSIDTSIENKNN